MVNVAALSRLEREMHGTCGQGQGFNEADGVQFTIKYTWASSSSFCDLL